MMLVFELVLDLISNLDYSCQGVPLTDVFGDF
jgi:hypothetical protein